MITDADRSARVKQVYSELDRRYEEEETQKKAFEHKIAYINLTGFPIDAQALALLPKETAETYQLGGFYKEGKLLKLGVVDPHQKIGKVVKQLADLGYTVEPFLISLSSFNHLLEGYSKILKVARRSDSIDLKKSDPRFAHGSIQQLGKQLVNTSATQIIEDLLGSALAVEASDIHLEPEKTDLKIRFRIDGVLQDIASVSLTIHHQLLSRIKIMSKMKLNIVAIPQDGSFSLTYDELPVDVRVSVLPSAFGESIVMRILRQDKGSLKFEELGITGLAMRRILREMEKPNGMILTTGPTGSGKTTTLYAILNKLNEPGVKIITLEDPVEYKLAGITQTPIDSRSGMTFATGLRAIMRQDPDIVMVGEMRDLETSETASQAALTGHIVLSTLHTNDASSAIPRLLDLGVKPFVLAPAINVIIGQRLVRKICKFCKREYKLKDNLQSRVELILRTIPKSAKVELPKILKFYHSTGCEKCNGLGYKGRVGVFEAFAISEAVEQLIHRSATTTEIKRQAIAEGMITMAQDGILKALQGITDIEEVFRVTEE